MPEAEINLERERKSRSRPASLEMHLDELLDLSPAHHRSASMALPAVIDTAPERVTDGDLSDEQIDELLARATARLQAKAGNGSTQLTQKFTFTKLNTGKLVKPYVTAKGDIASIDASRLLEEKHRTQANETRIVEDPAKVKKLALEVSVQPFLLSQRL